MVEIETLTRAKLHVLCDGCHEKLEARFLDIGFEVAGDRMTRRLLITPCPRCQDEYERENTEKIADLEEQVERLKDELAEVVRGGK